MEVVFFAFATVSNHAIPNQLAAFCETIFKPYASPYGGVLIDTFDSIVPLLESILVKVPIPHCIEPNEPLPVVLINPLPESILLNVPIPYTNKLTVSTIFSAL